MSTQSQRFGVLRVELFYDSCPKHTCGAHLGDFHEVVHGDTPEEREARGKGVDVHACVHTCAEVFETVGQGVCQLDVGGSAGLLHVVAGDRDGVELGHVLRGVFEDVGDNLHGECRRVDVCVTHHELLEDVVLDGTGHLVEGDALFQTCIDVEGEHGEHSAVHGHGN